MTKRIKIAAAVILLLIAGIILVAVIGHHETASASIAPEDFVESDENGAGGHHYWWNDTDLGENFIKEGVVSKEYENMGDDEKFVKWANQPADPNLVLSAESDVKAGKYSDVITALSAMGGNVYSLRNVEYVDLNQGLSHAEWLKKAGIWPDSSKFKFEDHCDTSKDVQTWNRPLLLSIKDDQSIYEDLTETLWGLYDSADDCWVEEGCKYTSLGQQRKDGIAPGIPLLIVDENPTYKIEGSYFLCYRWGGVIMRMRINCGYQPADIPTDPPSSTTTTTTTTTDNPPPTTTTDTTTTTLAPKEWDKNPQPEPDDDAYGSQESQETGATPEPDWRDYATTTTKTTSPDTQQPRHTERPATTTTSPVTDVPYPETTRTPLDSEVDNRPSPTETITQPADGNDGKTPRPSL